MARLPDIAARVSPHKLILNVESVGLTSEQFVRLCRDNPDLRLELTAQKEIVIMPPNWTKTGMQNAEISSQLWVWAKADGTGITGDSSTGFTLPNGAVRSPDASWIRRDRWDALTKDQQNSFAPICPDFLIELRSHGNASRTASQDGGVHRKRVTALLAHRSNGKKGSHLSSRAN